MRQTGLTDPRGPKCPLERASSLASSFARKAGASVHAWNGTYGRTCVMVRSWTRIDGQGLRK